MFKKLRSIAVLMVCIMMFSVVQPAFADNRYRTGSATGDAAVYGAGGGTLAAIGAAAVLTFFTGGAALPFIIGAAGATGAAGGAYYGYTEQNKTLKKDLTAAAVATVGGGAIGGVGVAVGALAAGSTTAGGAAGGAAAVGVGGAAINEANKPKNSPSYGGINGSYRYETDSLGRTTSATADTLQVKENSGRLPIKNSIQEIGRGYQQPGDDRGHLIGDQFGGSNGIENMIPQNASINRGAFKQFENDLASKIKAGSNVTDFTVEPRYTGNSFRPDNVTVTYKIDGVRYIRIFPNEAK